MPTFVSRSGFEILATYAYDSYHGITGEIQLLRWLVDRQVGQWHLGSLLQRALRRVPVLERSLGHMLVVLALERDTRHRRGRPADA